MPDDYFASWHLKTSPTGRSKVHWIVDSHTACGRPIGNKRQVQVHQAGGSLPLCGRCEALIIQWSHWPEKAPGN